jgi:hypothetical protein
MLSEVGSSTDDPTQSKHPYLKTTAYAGRPVLGAL